MKSHTQNYLFLFIIIGVLAFLLFQKPQTVKVKVPAIVGSISPAPISYLEPKGEPFKVIWRDKVIERKNPVNDSLFKAYTDLENKFKDQELELEQLKMYLDAITIRQFESQFEDPFLKLKVKGTVQGYLKNIEIERYEIKSREIEVPTYHRILAGFEAGNNTLLNDFRYKLNLGLQTPKGIIYRAGYAKEGLYDYVWMGADFTVFKF